MKKIIFALVLLSLAAPARAYRKPKNPRKHKKPSVAVGTETAKAPDEGLPPGRWAPEVRAAIMKFAVERGSGSPGYDPAKPPVAALPFNGFAVAGDPGELVFARLVKEAAFKFSDEFWLEVPLAYGRRRLRAAYEQFSTLPNSVWADQPTYQQFVDGFHRSYGDMCVKLDRKDCRAYLARLLIGFKDDEALQYAAQTLDTEPEAMRDVPEARALAAFLQKNGVEVWFVEADARPALLAAAKDWSVPERRLLGIRQGHSRERLDGQPIEPIPVREGKVDAFIEGAGRAADLIIGTSKLDVEFMSYGSGLRIVFAPDAGLAMLAKKKGWLIQPAF